MSKCKFSTTPYKISLIIVCNTSFSTGYDHAANKIKDRGDSVEVNAYYKTSPLLKNLERRADLDERISSMGCSCR